MAGLLHVTSSKSWLFAGVMQLAGVCMIGLELLLTVGVSFVKCILVVVLYLEKYSYLC